MINTKLYKIIWTELYDSTVFPSQLFTVVELSLAIYLVIKQEI